MTWCDVLAFLVNQWMDTGMDGATRSLLEKVPKFVLDVISLGREFQSATVLGKKENFL